jgi:hypothetical protein
MTRSNRRTLTFRHAFNLESVGRMLPAGDYDIVTDEELIEGVSFPVYRRVASWLLAPARGSIASMEMIIVDPVELAAAQASDAASKNSPVASTESISPDKVE